jgi:hypothetical protein
MFDNDRKWLRKIGYSFEPPATANWQGVRGLRLKTNAQLLGEITAAMADVWLAACDRRVIGSLPDGTCVVVDFREKRGLFGPASADECRVFIHRAAALDVLRMLGTERVAGASLVAGGNLPVTLNG